LRLRLIKLAARVVEHDSVKRAAAAREQAAVQGGPTRRLRVAVAERGWT
jgi:hypothetical protein